MAAGEFRRKLVPQRVRRIPRDRSSIGSIFLQIGQDFTEFHHRFSCRHFPSSRQRCPDPPLADGVEQKRIRNQWAAARRGRTEFGDHAIPVRDQHCFAASRQPDVFAELVFELFDFDDLMPIALEALLELEHHRFCLPSEVDAGAAPFSSSSNAGGGSQFKSAASVAVRARRLTDAPRPNNGVRARGSALVSSSTEPPSAFPPSKFSMMPSRDVCMTA